MDLATTALSLDFGFMAGTAFVGQKSHLSDDVISDIWISSRPMSPK